MSFVPLQKPSKFGSSIGALKQLNYLFLHTSYREHQISTATTARNKKVFQLNTNRRIADSGLHSKVMSGGARTLYKWRGTGPGTCAGGQRDRRSADGGTCGHPYMTENITFATALADGNHNSKVPLLTILTTYSSCNGYTEM